MSQSGSSLHTVSGTVIKLRGSGKRSVDTEELVSCSTGRMHLVINLVPFFHFFFLLWSPGSVSESQDMAPFYTPRAQTIALYAHHQDKSTVSQDPSRY